MPAGAVNCFLCCFFPLCMRRVSLSCFLGVKILVSTKSDIGEEAVGEEMSAEAKAGKGLSAEAKVGEMFTAGTKSGKGFTSGAKAGE